MLVYEALNIQVATSVPAHCKLILDAGCGSGNLGAYLTQKTGAVVDGITFSEQEAGEASKHLNKVFVENMNDLDVSRMNRLYDCIICSHVLEHLYEPWQVVARLEKVLAPGGLLIIAIPNLLFFKQRWQLLKGNFEYSLHGGPMDITHFRFFDWHSSSMLLKDSQLTLIKKQAFGMFPQPLLRRIFPSLCNQVDKAMVRRWPGLFGMQFLITAQKTPAS